MEINVRDKKYSTTNSRLDTTKTNNLEIQKEKPHRMAQRKKDQEEHMCELCVTSNNHGCNWSSPKEGQTGQLPEPISVNEFHIRPKLQN